MKELNEIEKICEQLGQEFNSDKYEKLLQFYNLWQGNSTYKDTQIEKIQHSNILFTLNDHWDTYFRDYINHKIIGNYNSKNFDEVITDCESLLKFTYINCHKTSFAEVQYRLGLAYLGKSLFSKAKQYFELALNYPSLPRYLKSDANIQLNKINGKLSDADAEMKPEHENNEELSPDGPNQTDENIFMGIPVEEQIISASDAKELSKELEKGYSKEIVQKLLEFINKSGLAARSKTIKQIKNFTRPHVKKYEEDTLKEIKSLYEEKKYQQLITRCNRFITYPYLKAKYSYHAQLYFYMGNSYTALSDTKNALHYFQQAKENYGRSDDFVKAIQTSLSELKQPNSKKRPRDESSSSSSTSTTTTTTTTTPTSLKSQKISSESHPNTRPDDDTEVTENDGDNFYNNDTDMQEPLPEHASSSSTTLLSKLPELGQLDELTQSNEKLKAQNEELQQNLHDYKALFETAFKTIKIEDKTTRQSATLFQSHIRGHHTREVKVWDYMKSESQKAISKLSNSNDPNFNMETMLNKLAIFPTFTKACKEKDFQSAAKSINQLDGKTEEYYASLTKKNS